MLLKIVDTYFTPCKAVANISSEKYNKLIFFIQI